MHSRRHQGGQMLIGAVMATGLLALALVGVFRLWQVHRQTTMAGVYGQALSQYAVGLRGYIANVQGGSATLPSNPYTAIGVNWLKPPACGGLAGNPTQGYVPCAFDGGPLGRAYNTTIQRTPATNEIEARTDFFVPKSMAGEAATGKLAAATARAALAQQELPPNGMFYNIFPNAPETANANVPVQSITPADRGRVLLVVNNAPSNDMWLRVDGTNKMLADLDMGGHSVDNAANGTFSGDLRVKGVAQIDKGLTVDDGPADFRDGVTANDVKATSVDRTMSQALYNMEVVTGATSYQIPKPDCSQANLGNSQPSIYVAMQSTGAAADYTFPGGSPSDALYAARVRVVSYDGYWEIYPEIRTTRFWLNGSSNDGTVTVTLHKDVSALQAAQDQAVLVMTKCR